MECEIEEFVGRGFGKIDLSILNDAPHTKPISNSYPLLVVLQDKVEYKDKAKVKTKDKGFSTSIFMHFASRTTPYALTRQRNGGGR